MLILFQPMPALIFSVAICRLMFAANFTDTEITRIFSNVDTLLSIDPDVIFGGFQPSVVETWQPKDRSQFVRQVHARELERQPVI